MKNNELIFIESAKKLIDENPYVSFMDLLTDHNVIPPLRKKRPPPSYIEQCGYRHDGRGNILRKNGRILKHTTNGGTGKKYKVYHIIVPGYGSEKTNYRDYCIQGHTLIFALHHRRYHRDGYVLDHIDDNPFNNHPDNLIETTYLKNNWHVKEKVGSVINNDNIEHGTLESFFDSF